LPFLFFQSINLCDCRHRTSTYTFRAVPGSEFAGVVTEVAPDVTDIKVGQRVFGGGALGGFAEEIVVPSTSVLGCPSSLSFEEAAGLYLTLPTAFAGLVTRASLTADETCVITGAAGAVGICAGNN
jgi:NADPH2:quinone reductase